MWTTVYIKSNERGSLYYRGDFRRFLRPGTYRYSWGSLWSVTPHNLSQPEVKLDNLELLLQTHRPELDAHLHTAF